MFLDVTGQIKIGDFGLATTDLGYNLYGDIDISLNLNEQDKTPQKLPPQRPYPVQSVFCEDGGSKPPTIASSELNYDDGHTSGIGTALYRAPEQDSLSLSSPRMVYDSLVDIYSLGIILFELCHEPFQTGMERVETIKRLRNLHELPEDFRQKSNKYIDELILWMVNVNPLHRPSAQEILESKIFHQWELSLECFQTSPFNELSPPSLAPQSSADSIQYENENNVGFCQECYEKIDAIDMVSPFAGAIRITTPSTSTPPILLKNLPPALTTVLSHVDIIEVPLPYGELRQFGTLISLLSTTQADDSYRVPIQSLYRQLQLYICEQRAESKVVMEGVLQKLIEFDKISSTPSVSTKRRYCILQSFLDSYFDLIIYSADLIEEYLEQRSG